MMWEGYFYFCEEIVIKTMFPSNFQKFLIFSMHSNISTKKMAAMTAKLNCQSKMNRPFSNVNTESAIKIFDVMD